MKRVLLFSLLGLILALSACAPLRTYVVASQPVADQPSRVLSQRPLRQSFVTPDGGVSEIELVLVLPESAPALAQRPLHWEIRSEQQQVLRQGTIETAGYLHNAPLSLRFEPLPPGQRLELALTALPEAQLSLWSSRADNYPEGALADNDLDGGVDLYFTLRVRESPLSVFEQLGVTAERWRSAALWLPLLIVTPGWLLLWLLRPGGKRPLSPLAAGMSLSLAPLVYLWSGVIGLRLYEPLVQSLFQATLLLLLLLMVRHPERVQAAWRRRWVAPLALVGAALLLSIVTWLLAMRGVTSMPGSQASRIAALGDELVREGLLSELSAPLAPSTLAATLTQVSRQPVDHTLILGAMLLGVSLLPALYGLAAEITGDPWAALWVLPLAWLWPAPWQAIGRGDLASLFHMAILPVAVALGLRALRVSDRPWRTLLLAAVPLAALALGQGVAVAAPWLAALLLALALRRPMRPEEGDSVPPRWPETLVRAWLWLFLALLLWLPAWFLDVELLPEVAPMISGYLLLLATILLALLAGLARRMSRGAALAAAAVALLALPGLTWWRSSPMRQMQATPSPPAVTPAAPNER